MDPLRKLINPKVYGIENVPQQHALLVGNHTVMGMLDSPLMCAELWEHGIIVRSLGDHAHFKIPMWRDVLTACGVVDGTRAITSELMRRGEVILVYPGGGREVAKRKCERYQLIWKERMGFARLAIEHGYSIVPFAAVGAEEAVDIIVDGDNPLLAPTRLFVEKVLGSKDVMPIMRGIGITPARPSRDRSASTTGSANRSQPRLSRASTPTMLSSAQYGIGPRGKSSTGWTFFSPSGTTIPTVPWCTGY